ncbi:isocitrate dehydrogenase [Neorickettsia risticii]|uniref:Isocitrate dehydrogenase [NADP] n=1 Tax=Neorickettsia risticii (strain Illinois) TaxID=434131 RepID=C6V444_NEORI|nr:isocitrate dehydrogenase [Neorickettsia risticii]ACT69161.1 isocitrate dehydrogenase [Neorickettsia risticii str. Illinois]
MPKLTVAYGDGVGPEIMTSVLEIIFEAGAEIQIDTIEIGQKIYEKGWPSGISDSGWETLKRNKVLLKAPITTPRGGGVRSLNVTLRKKLGLFANIRPCKSHLEWQDPKMDIVIIRENEEDLYSGIEYRQTLDTYNCTKVITESTSERICRYAFEYARSNGRKKVTVMVKDNIMKLTDGIFHKLFKKVALEYPDIESENYIIDIGAARIAKNPEKFDVIVTLNLYGDIISDIAAEISGSVGLGGSINIGEEYAMFEAVHGSAPDIADQDIANPSGLLNAAMYMLSYIGQKEIAQKVYSAWLKTLKSGVHTADIFNPLHSKLKVGTKKFTEHIIHNIDRKSLVAFSCNSLVEGALLKPRYQSKKEKVLIGVDLFVSWDSTNLAALLAALEKIKVDDAIIMGSISVKGVLIWPEETAIMPYSDTLCCRFLAEPSKSLATTVIYGLMNELENSAIEVTRMEKLYSFADEAGFSNI